MLKHSAVRLVTVIALSLVAARGLVAQATAASDTANDTSGTYLTLAGNGVGRIVPGSVSDVTVRVRTVLIKMKIVQERDRPLRQGGRELRGKKGLVDVSVRLRSESTSSTRVEVTALRGPANPDEELARQVIDEIQKAK